MTTPGYDHKHGIDCDCRFPLNHTMEPHDGLRWVDPRDFQAALYQRDQARKEAKKYERRWKRTEQKLAEMERLYGELRNAQSDGDVCA